MRKIRPFAAAPLAAFVLLAGAALGPLSAASPSDWPQWLGPQRNGTSPAKGVFSASGPVRLRKVWSLPIESGWAGLAVSGDRLYTLTADEENDYALALDAATGKEVWRARLDPRYAVAENGPGSTPAVDGNRVFVISPSCRLQALDTANGNVVWQHHLKDEYGSGSHRRGCMTSPLVEGDLLVVQVSGETENRLMAFNKASGAVVWTSKASGRTGPSSPIVADLGGVRQVVVNYLETLAPPLGGLYGARLTDGTILWKHVLDKGFSFDTPLVLPGDRLFLQTFNSDLRLIQVKAREGKLTADPAWVVSEQGTPSSPPVYHDGHLYGVGGDFLLCLDAATGKPVWKEKIYAGSVILVDGHLVIQSQTAGLLRVVEATSAGYREKARLEVLTPGAPGNTPPSFTGLRIYVRNAEEIAAVEVGAGEPK
jgi:outer membrane protein assembly factor BamB